MMVDAGHVNTFKRKITEPGDRFINLNLACLHFSQQLFDSLLVQMAIPFAFKGVLLL
jgi:hypothetical protein